MDASRKDLHSPSASYGAIYGRCQVTRYEYYFGHQSEHSRALRKTRDLKKTFPDSKPVEDLNEELNRVETLSRTYQYGRRNR